MQSEANKCILFYCGEVVVQHLPSCYLETRVTAAASFEVSNWTYLHFIHL